MLSSSIAPFAASTNRDAAAFEVVQPLKAPKESLMSAQEEAAKPGLSSRYSFRVQGLDCAEEVAVLRREVGPLVGDEGNLAFDVLNGRMTILESIGCGRTPGRRARHWC